MITSPGERQHGDKDRGLSRCRDQGAVGVFKLGDHVVQRKGRRRAVDAVIDPLERILRRFAQRLDGWKQHGRGMVDRRIDDAMVGHRIAPGMDESRVVPVLRLKIRVRHESSLLPDYGPGRTLPACGWGAGRSSQAPGWMIDCSEGVL